MLARFSRVAVGLLLSVAVCVACNETPPDLRPWRASDHDHTANPNADQVQVTDAGAGKGDPNHALDEVTIVAWQQNCTSCHGPLGRGDGPQGQLLHASDLSRPDWQASVTDQVIANTIRAGRGRMPAFNLPDATVTRLVALIRMLDLNKMQRVMNAAAAADSAAPASSASASASGSGSVRPAPSATAPKRVGR